MHRAIARRSFATLATTSPDGLPHVAGVLFALVGRDLWVNTMRHSRKARNIEASERVAVTIPVRRLPVGPPSTIQFQGRAVIIARTSDRVRALAESGAIAAITGHGELDLDGSCFLKIWPTARLHTHGLGMSLRALITDPLSAGRSISTDELPWTS